MTQEEKHQHNKRQAITPISYKAVGTTDAVVAFREWIPEWGAEKVHNWSPNVVWQQITRLKQKETGEIHINLQESAFIVEVKCKTITERNSLIDYINSNGYEFICK